jgi:hypothetical protein
MTEICIAAESPYYSPDRLNLFDRIDIAACAAARARIYVADSVRFRAEYDTAAAWSRKR